MTLLSIQKLIKNDLLDLESQIKFRSKTNIKLINELSEHIISGGGKRLRPVVLFLSAYSIKNDKENAFKNIDQALALPDVGEDVQLALLVSAGQSAVRLGDFDKGLSYYESALEINPLEVPALKSLGALYLAQDKYEPALKNLNAAIENSNDDKEKIDLFFNRGLVYLKMNEFEEAEYNFEEAYFLAPDDKEALLGLAKALEQAERWRKSRTYYLELIDSDPNNASYYYGVYRTYFGEGRLEDATEYLTKANALK